MTEQHYSDMSVDQIIQAEIKKLTPVPTVLCCPVCMERHYDEGEWAVRYHRTHQCQNCQHEWQPFDVPTVGVRNFPVNGAIKEQIWNDIEERRAFLNRISYALSLSLANPAVIDALAEINGELAKLPHRQV